MHITFEPPSDLPADASAFWRDTQQEQDPAGFFTSSPDWCALMAGDDPDAAVAVARGDGDAPRAVVPLLPRTWSLQFGVGSRRLAHRQMRVCQVPGGDLTAPGLDASDLAGIWRQVFAERTGVEGVWFDHLGSEDRLQAVLQSCRQGRGLYAHVPFHGTPHYRMKMPGTLDECLKLRSAKSLQRLRSKGRALARERGAPVDVIELRTREEWAPYVERIESLINHSWQAESLGQTYRLENFQGTADRGWLRCFLLLCGEDALAFTLNYQGMGTMVSGILAYDRSVARYSPGALLFLRTLEMLYARDTPGYLDFGEGDAEYKEQWATAVIHVSAVLVVRSRLSLRFLFWLQRNLRRGVFAGRCALRIVGIERKLARKLKLST